MFDHSDGGGLYGAAPLSSAPEQMGPVLSTGILSPSTSTPHRRTQCRDQSSRALQQGIAESHHGWVGAGMVPTLAGEQGGNGLDLSPRSQPLSHQYQSSGTRAADAVRTVNQDCGLKPDKPRPEFKDGGQVSGSGAAWVVLIHRIDKAQPHDSGQRQVQPRWRRAVVIADGQHALDGRFVEVMTNGGPSAEN